jgi:hypothetical protein
MARPPIVVSNGGVVGELAAGIDDPKAEQKILANMHRITKENVDKTHLSKVVILKKGGANTACLYWRLTGNDTKHKVKEGPTINEIVDEKV